MGKREEQRRAQIMRLTDERDDARDLLCETLGTLVWHKGEECDCRRCTVVRKIKAYLRRTNGRNEAESTAEEAGSFDGGADPVHMREVRRAGADPAGPEAAGVPGVPGLLVPAGGGGDVGRAPVTLREVCLAEAHEREMAALEGAVRALCEALPRCGGASDGPEPFLERLCAKPATKAWGRAGARYCDEHAPEGCPDYPRAAPLRAVLAALEGQAVEPTEIVKAFRAFEADHEHLPIVIVDSEDTATDGRGWEETVHEREHHRLVYRDQRVALTTYEICYGLWCVETGGLIMGKLWGDGSKALLDVSTLPALTPEGRELGARPAGGL